jgi:hypothetical protein
MDADLDTLSIAVYCTAHDLLPPPPVNARRMVTDPEPITLCVAQAIMGIPSDRRFLRVAAKRLCHLFAELPAQPGYHKRRRRIADTIEWLMGVLASQSPGDMDDLLLIDSTLSRVRQEPSRPSSARHSRMLPTSVGAPAIAAFSGGSGCMRSSLPTGLHVRSRSPRPNMTNVWWASSCSPDAGAREARSFWVTRVMPAAISHAPSVNWVRPCVPVAKTHPGHKAHLAPIRQRIESIFWTCKDLLTLERHGARTLSGLRERIAQRILCLASCVWLNHQLGRSSRALVDDVA